MQMVSLILQHLAHYAGDIMAKCKTIKKKRKKKVQKIKIEWSKLVCGILVLYGMTNGMLYNIAVFMDKSPDPTLAVQSVTTIIGGYMSYLIYQFGLKNSRNKFGVDSDGNPFAQHDGGSYCGDETESFG